MKLMKGLRSLQKMSLKSLKRSEEDAEILTTALLSEDKDKQVMDELNSEEPSSSDEDEYRRRAVSVSFKGEFLQNFFFPSLSDISTESSEQLLSLRRTLSVKGDMSFVDEGQFVDPLTGEPIKEPIEAEAEEQVAEVSVEAEEESSSSTSSFDWPFPLEDEVAAPVQADTAEYAMEMLMEINSAVRPTSAESTTAQEAQRLERENRQICIDFVYKAIDDAVNAAEYVDPDAMLASKLDKHKVIRDLHRIIADCLAAKQFNQDLCSKMYEYYRRVGQFRVFEPLPREAEEEEFRRQRHALYMLDHLKQKADETKKRNNMLLASVTMDMNHVRNISLSTVALLENRIRNTLSRKDLQFLPRIVEHELRQMQAMRNEISDNRLWLITRQHTLGRVIERKRNFDQITPDLTMDEFLNAQRDVTALGTKVEERNRDLNRMRDRSTKHVHQLAFIREKMSMISITLISHKKNLSRKIRRQNELRDELLEAKLQHARLTAQIRALHVKCGLLYKPALLHDYDETVEAVEIKRENVNKCRIIVKDLEARIAMFEGLARSTITSQEMKKLRKVQLRKQA
ncbi:coiled-coil domain-containing protein 96-like isoform X2 [Drosophila novamexicana]|uniref:coiled-coil domain-containing protein 96-like isoform X2 n=1 Tax=Drosophila novamexicana TaxID=47314 RepID=UPI0011E58E19|nr:coiled-coil domain-containing protein 96-like isoform X2 [Drosophila novamexicana]